MKDCYRKACVWETSVAIASLTFVSLAFPLFSSTVGAVQLSELESIVAPTNVTELIYSPGHNSLVLKNSASAIMTLDLGTQSSTTHFPNYDFTDMAMSPSGDYLFAADYGGENIGYGTPKNTSYVHRLDLSNNIWETKTAYIAGNIQAVSDTQLILKSLDQGVTFTNNSWGAGSAVIPLNTASGSWGPAYYAWVCFGNFRYETRSGRLLHGNSGSSSQEINAFKIVNNDFQQQEGSGVYGSAQGYGGTVTLATDSSAFYYGKLQVDPLDASHNLRVFPEMIYAATGDIAFANGSYYNAHTGELSGSLGFQTQTYALNPGGTDFWAYDSSENMLRHFTMVLAKPTVATAAVSSISSTAAFAGGNVLDVGDAPVTARGVCWSTSQNPTTANICANVAPGVGPFTVSMTGLNSGTLYHARAYATNSPGTGFGSDLVFCTFCPSSAVRIESTPYAGIQDSIMHALPGDVIKSNVAVFSEDLTFSNSEAISLQGGYDCDFGATPGFSTVNSLIIEGTGSVTIANIVIL